jgi:hypothetical protein
LDAGKICLNLHLLSGLIFQDHRQVPVKVFRAKIALKRVTGRFLELASKKKLKTITTHTKKQIKFFVLKNTYLDTFP